MFALIKHSSQLRQCFLAEGHKLIPARSARRAFELLHATFDLSEMTECSLEVNPGGQSAHHFKTWSKLGINRLSVGVQVLDDQVLEKMNRPQKSDEVHQFFEQAPQYISNLSADLIIGLPGVADQVWRQTVNQALRWPISHISLYFLTVHQHTQLYHGVKAGSVRLPKDDTVLAQYAWTTEQIEKHGLAQYEISNFALQGRECFHNQGYWQRKTYQGFGLGAASFDGACRYANERKLTKYIELNSTAHSDDEQTCSYFEQLTPQQHQMEEVMLGLRQRGGLDLRDVVYLENRHKSVPFFYVQKQLEHEGYLTQEGTRLILTRKGQIFENEVIVRLCRGLEGDHQKTKQSKMTTMNAD